MKYLDVIVSVLSGLTVCLPLAAKLAQYAAQAVRERNWTKLMNLTLRYMGWATLPTVTVTTLPLTSMTGTCFS